MWDTNGMYNDMLNDHNRNYWCFRNKVKQNKVISVSGKCPCLSCGEQVIDYDDYEAWQYNERYRHVSNVICEDCMNEHFCYSCNRQDPLEHFYKVFIGNEIMYICKQCYSKNIKACPGCGKPLFIKNIENDYITAEENTDLELFKTKKYSSRMSEEENGTPIVMCHDCMVKHIDDFVEKHIETVGISFRWFQSKGTRWIFFKGDPKFYYPCAGPYVEKEVKDKRIVYPVINRLDVIRYLDEKTKNT